jgi:glutathione S-transferase
MNLRAPTTSLRLAGGVPPQAALTAAPERAQPFPPLLQGSARARALGHAIEQWADASLRPLALRFYCQSDAPTPQLQRALAHHPALADALLTDADFALGEQPSAADFALFGPLATLLESEAGRAHVQHWPSLRGFAERMAALDRRGSRIADLPNLERCA